MYVFETKKLPTHEDSDSEFVFNLMKFLAMLNFNHFSSFYFQPLNRLFSLNDFELVSDNFTQNIKISKLSFEERLM